MTDHPDTSEGGKKFLNYNVRYRDRMEAVYAWRETTQIPVKVFENFDGGGFNYYICEFETLGDAEAFRTHFKIQGDKTLWGEDAQGNVHYLSGATHESRRAVVSLAREGFVPIKLEDLDLSTDEMQTLADGASLLFAPDFPSSIPEPDLESDAHTDDNVEPK
jgi:hypothetical protein